MEVERPGGQKRKGEYVGEGSRKVLRISLHRPREWLWRGDVMGYLVGVNLVLAFYLWAALSKWGEETAGLDGGEGKAEEPSLLAPETLCWMALVGLSAAELLVLLACEWNVRLRTALRFSSCADVSQATVALVLPRHSQGLPQLCPLSSSPRLHFYFQNSRYSWHPQLVQFKKAKYPVSFPLKVYQSQAKALTNGRGAVSVAVGLSGAQVVEAAESFPKNELPVPVPEFRELFREHLVAPFFVFQLFCCALWMLDEYWMYSMMTGLMLFALEALVVKQRLGNLGILRNMIRAPYPVKVWRNQHWASIPSSQLLPGDLLALEPHPERLLPCDALLIAGSAVVNESMLTGESKPQRKESIQTISPDDQLLDFRRDRDAHILSAGTTLIQTQSLQVGGNGGPHAPNPECCLGYVLRTGFETDQGRLLRTILFSTQPVTANNPESGYFILFLLAFALAAVGYLIRTGLDSGRSPHKLFLEACFVLTSVVPPELPLVLSMAVNSSLRALSQAGIFCTEPFRVPFGGRIDVACFDKTGTLTSDTLDFRGFAGLDPSDLSALHLPSSSAPLSLPPASLSLLRHCELVVAGCQSLIKSDRPDGPIGDPIEVAAFRSIGWTLPASDARPVVPADPRDGRKLMVVRRFPFSSTLKRMTTVASVLLDQKPSLAVLCKGAPEYLRPFLATVPPFFDACSTHFALEGARVVCAAYKLLDLPHVDVMKLSRAQLEEGLTFAGFLIFSCPLKPDSIPVLQQIHDSSHRTVMITGDNVLTACHAARLLSIVSRRLLLISRSPAEPSSFLLLDPAEPSFSQPLTEQSLNALRPHTDFAISGMDLQALNDSRPEPWVRRLINLIEVFARVTPQQKEAIILSLNSHGHQTLMCGDGTNDVGALKHAHVGMALVTAPPSQSDPVSSPSSSSSAASSSFAPAAVPKGKPSRKQSVVTTKPTSQSNNRGQTPSPLDDVSDRALVQLGDASIAAPFSTKSSSIKPLLHLLMQARCTLVTTYQMFTILALNSLLQAYSLSVLYVAGVKFGDVQMTLPAFLITGCFMSISHVKPLEKLSPERPPGRLFTVRIFLSILTQFAIHMASLLYITDLARSFMPADLPADLDGKFAPSLLNSTVFLLSLSMQVTTFLANFQGPPFMQPLHQSKPLLVSITLTLFFIFLLATELLPGLNDIFELVHFPPAFKTQLLAVLAGDLILCVSTESAFRFVRRLIFRPHSARSNTF